MKKIISYILLFVWLILIFLLSNQSGNISSSNSQAVLYHLNMNENAINIVHGPLREFMHGFEYFILAILIVNLLKQYKMDNIIIISLMLCFIYSTTDEIHQLFVIGRSFEYKDVLYDFIGSFLGTIISNKLIKRLI